MRRGLPILLLLALPAAAAAGERGLDYTRLANGLELIVVQRQSAPIVTIELVVKAGSFVETPATNGLASLYQRMFFRGNAALPTQERYQARVAELGINSSGEASTERVRSALTLPARNFADGMSFLADAVLTPLFNAEEVERERSVVLAALEQQEADPAGRLFRALEGLLYGEEAYRKNPMGDAGVLKSVTPEALRALRARYYVPNNCLLLVVGDVNPTEAKVLTEQLLGPQRWPAGPDPRDPPRPPLPRLRETRGAVVPLDTPLVALAARWPGPDVGRDERGTFVADVWSRLCALPHGRLQRAFREGALASQASLLYYTQREGGELQFLAVVRDEKVAEVRDALLAEVSAMAEASYWTETDLALAKRALRVDRAFDAESGAELARTLGFWWASSSVDYYARYLEETGSVTLTELRDFARDYIAGRPSVMACLASPEALERLGLTPETLRPAPAGGTAAASAVEEVALDNGARALIRRTPGSAVSALQVVVDGGCLDLRPDEQGIDDLLLAALLDGSARTSPDALQAELVSLGARVASDTSYDTSRISLVTPREGFARAVELVAECLREPRLDPQAVGQRRSQMLTALNVERGEPERYVVRVLNRSFFAGHPYLLRPNGTPETIPALEPDALRRRLGELLVSGRVLLVLVGDTDGASARRLLQAQFGFLPSKAWRRPPTPPFQPGEPVTLEVCPATVTYLLGKSAAPPPGHADYPATRLATALLNSRLWTRLCGEAGLALTARAGVSAFRANYAYVMATTGRPQEVIDQILDEVRRLQEEPVTAAELQGMVAQAETLASSRFEQALTHAEDLAHAELSGAGWRSLYELPHTLGRVTPEDVRRVSKAHLSGFHFGLIGPGSASPEESR